MSLPDNVSINIFDTDSIYKITKFGFRLPFVGHFLNRQRSAFGRSTVFGVQTLDQADFQKYNGSSNLRSYLHVTNFAELQMWHFMIISN